uniref:Uncharacterized protein n=1 Tax=Glossina palpalis gambiensis TaxID=67801 RepID=A0A1B0BSB8_9MUSC
MHMQAVPTAAIKANMPAVLKHNLTSSFAKWHRFHATSTSSQLKQLSQPRATLLNQKQQIMDDMEIELNLSVAEPI